MRSTAIVDDSPTQRGCGERALPVTEVATTRGDGDSNCDWNDNDCGQAATTVTELQTL